MKYSKTPKISMLVVTNGPVAIAGSISNFLKNKGIRDPTATAISIEAQIVFKFPLPDIFTPSANTKGGRIKLGGIDIFCRPDQICNASISGFIYDFSVMCMDLFYFSYRESKNGYDIILCRNTFYKNTCNDKFFHYDFQE